MIGHLTPKRLPPKPVSLLAEDAKWGREARARALLVEMIRAGRTGDPAALAAEAYALHDAMMALAYGAAEVVQ